MERLMLQTLKFALTQPTVYQFMPRLHMVGDSTEDERRLANYVAELAMLEYQTLEFKPSVVAASCVYIARRITRRDVVWVCLTSFLFFKFGAYFYPRSLLLWGWVGTLSWILYILSTLFIWQIRPLTLSTTQDALKEISSVALKSFRMLSHLLRRANFSRYTRNTRAQSRTTLLALRNRRIDSNDERTPELW